MNEINQKILFIAVDPRFFSSTEASMKTRPIFLLIVIIALISGCSTPEATPTVEVTPTAPFQATDEGKALPPVRTRR